MIYLVLEYTNAGSSAFTLSKSLIKSVSMYISKPLLISGLHINYLSREVSNYLLILLIVVLWYALGLLENLANWYAMINISSQVCTTKYNSEPITD